MHLSFRRGVLLGCFPAGILQLILFWHLFWPAAPPDLGPGAQYMPSPAPVPSRPPASASDSSSPAAGLGQILENRAAWSQDTENVYFLATELTHPAGFESVNAEEAVVMLAIGDDYVSGVPPVMYSLIEKGLTRPVVVVMSPTATDEQVKTVLTAGAMVTFSFMELPTFLKPDVDHWRMSYHKVWFWRLGNFQRLLALDVDVFVQENLDSLFAVEGDLVAKQDYNQCARRDGRFASGVMLLRPTPADFTSLTTILGTQTENGRANGDQDVLNELFHARISYFPQGTVVWDILCSMCHGQGNPEHSVWGAKVVAMFYKPWQGGLFFDNTWCDAPDMQQSGNPCRYVTACQYPKFLAKVSFEDFTSVAMFPRPLPATSS